MVGDQTDETVDLPSVREYPVPAHDGIPSNGFITPHSRDRHEIVENLTDTSTAMMLYALVHRGPHGNYGDALKLAIQTAYRDLETTDGVSWRYYCRDCEFIGAASRTHAESEAGSQRHSEVCDDDDVVVFAYNQSEWKPEKVQSLVTQYRNTRNE